MTDQDQERVSLREEEEAEEPVVVEGEVVEELPQEKAPPEEAVPVQAEPEVDELDALREQLAATEAQAAEYLDGWQRSRAEFINYRRREEQRRQQMEEEVRGRALVRVLGVLDDMQRAFQAVPEEVRDTPWVKGLAIVGHELETVLEKEGVSVMPVGPGDTFDPAFHEAVTHEPSEEFPEGKVVAVVRRGYTLNGAVLRPALVRVSSGSSSEGSESSSAVRGE
jgi:molecular chaperone GrpE